MSIQQVLTSCPDLNRFQQHQENLLLQYWEETWMGWSQVALRKLRLLLFS